MGQPVGDLGHSVIYCGNVLNPTYWCLVLSREFIMGMGEWDDY